MPLTAMSQACHDAVSQASTYTAQALASVQNALAVCGKNNGGSEIGLLNPIEQSMKSAADQLAAIVATYSDVAQQS